MDRDRVVHGGGFEYRDLPLDQEMEIAAVVPFVKDDFPFGIMLYKADRFDLSDLGRGEVAEGFERFEQLGGGLFRSVQNRIPVPAEVQSGR